MPVTEEFVKMLMEEIVQLNQTIESLNQTIRELQEKLNQNSKNSSRPPSSDGLKKPLVNKDRSLRRPSGRKPGGQNGHEGRYFSALSKPDHTEHHMHSDCTCCPYHDACLEKACTREVRHEVDAVLKTDVTAHKLMMVKDCPLHGGTKAGSFPENIKAAVQYGRNLQALVVAFNTVGAVSIHRTHEILSSVFQISLATGTIKNMVGRCAQILNGTYEEIRRQMSRRDLIHCDETGTRVDGKTCWVHNASDSGFTFLSISRKRGQAGMNEAGILPVYHGTLVHDCWNSYWKYEDVRHAVCCAHLLRELNGVEQNHPEQTWAPEFKKLLLSMKKAKEKALAKGKAEISRYYHQKFDKQYDALLKTAYAENPLPEPGNKKRGRPKKGRILNLIGRLDKYKASVCLFINDLTVPFDNNQAEWDIRMVKVKTKVSGCFRSMEGAQEYLIIMSYIGTARKHGINPYEAIQSALSGRTGIIFE